MAKAGLIFLFNHGAEAPCKTQTDASLVRQPCGWLTWAISNTPNILLRLTFQR